MHRLTQSLAAVLLALLCSFAFAHADITATNSSDEPAQFHYVTLSGIEGPFAVAANTTIVVSVDPSDIITDMYWTLDNFPTCAQFDVNPFAPLFQFVNCSGTTYTVTGTWNAIPPDDIAESELLD